MFTFCDILQEIRQKSMLRSTDCKSSNKTTFVNKYLPYTYNVGKLVNDKVVVGAN